MKKRLKTFEVFMEGGRTMIVRAYSGLRAVTMARDAARQIVGKSPKVLHVRAVKVVGFGMFEEAT